MIGLKFNHHYRIKCKGKDWGINDYGIWEFYSIERGFFWFTDENGASLLIPMTFGYGVPTEPWMLELELLEN